MRIKVYFYAKLLILSNFFKKVYQIRLYHLLTDKKYNTKIARKKLTEILIHIKLNKRQRQKATQGLLSHSLFLFLMLHSKNFISKLN